MTLTVVNAFNPVWNDPNGISILLTVQFKEFADPVQFVATPMDPEPHGKDLFNMAAAGMYGPVAPFPLSVEQQLTNLKALLCARVDSQAEKIRLSYLSPGAGQAMVYQAKYEEAVAVQSDPNPTNDKYPILAATLGVEGQTLLAISNLVLATRSAWMTAASAIETVRLGSKTAINATTTITDANAAYSMIVWPPNFPG